MPHPYTNLPGIAFWKTGVAERDPNQIDLEWAPKASIRRNTKIITVGSCFAQHISKALRDEEFLWLDSEPAPANLPKEERAKDGYGVFSFRTGNIYTVALLKQWIQWALGESKPSQDVIFEEGRYFDPFRPSLIEAGFSSAKGMLNARRATLDAISGCIKQADLFIFTLGLTEAWRDLNGSVYPMCPGTIRGVFSAEQHRFHNYSAHEIERDLVAVFDLLRKINPALRFLLTVSPVPLTATASGQHVLTATTYSKSVLRAVAGELALTREDTDYFPAYELITAPAFKGRWFEENMRSVSPTGVAFVMRQFIKAITAETQAETDALKTKNITDHRKDTFVATKTDEICDDIILESWASHVINPGNGDSPELLLLGDSQIAMIANELKARGIPYRGGAIMNGSDWHLNRFALHDNLEFRALPLDAEDRWKSVFSSKVLNKNSLVITNVGFHVSAFFDEKIGLFGSQFVKSNPNGTYTVDTQGLIGYLESVSQQHWFLIKELTKAGFRVIWVSNPFSKIQSHWQLMRLGEKLYGNMIKEHCAADAFMTCEWIDSLGGLTSDLKSKEIDPVTGDTDIWHGSPYFYSLLVKKIFSSFDIGTASVNDA